MTDPTRPPDATRSDAAQADALDRYLDALARGERPAASDLDPTLAATVRRAHALGDDGVRATTRRAGKARRWETIMRSMTTSPINRGAISPFPFGAIAPPFADSSRGVRQPSRPRRLPGGPLGLVATLALVLVIGAAGLATMLTAPDGGGEPTSLPAAYAATPEATPLVGDQTDDLSGVTVISCPVGPMAFDDVMAMLSAPVAGQPYDESYVQSYDTNPLSRASLPDGGPVSEEVRTQVTSLYGAYLGCYMPLQQAALFTDAGLLRHYRTQESALLSAQQYELLWLDEQGDGTPPGFDRDSLSFDTPGPFSLYGFREIAPDTIGAYLAVNGQLERGGFVVFVRNGDGWLIDEIRPVPAG